MLWAEQRRELDLLIATGLEHPDVKDELRALGIPAAEVARAVRDKPEMLAGFRRQRTLAENPDDRRLWQYRLGPYRMRPAASAVVGLALVGGYTVLLVLALPLMPLGHQLFALAGLVAVVVLAGRLFSGGVRMTYRAILRARDPGAAERNFLHAVVVPELRQYLAEQREPIYGTELSVDQTRLDRDEHEAPPVVTGVGAQLRRILARTTPEAVAIAGPRGVGKTTTIHAIADGVFSEPYAYPPLPVLAAAPSRYDARDFLLHLYALLCQQVIELTSAVLRLPAGTGGPRRVWRALRWPVAVVLSLAMLGGTAALLWPGELGVLLWPGHPDVPHRDVSGRAEAALILADLMYGIFLFALILLTGAVPRLGVAVRRLVLRKRHPQLRPLRDEAFAHLRRIRFLQSYTSGWSGKVGLPGGADLGWSASVQRAEQNLTHPEVVENFRRFAARSARTLVSANLIDRLVIAIDEVDKIADPAQAHELLNDIKGVFGVPGCLFLVSVSEDAMSAFERRGIPVRDAFDSAFTQMVRMDNFTLAESRRWLSRRLLGVPEQFAHLLHCLSGGLPRELRRMTIELVDVVAEDERGDLAHVTGVLLAREVDRKTHAFAAAARRFDDTAELSEYLADLVTVPDARTPAEQVALAARLAPSEAASELRRVRWQSACFLLFCATVLEIFDNTLDEQGLGKGLESLALARAQMAVDPRVAWRLVESTRAAFSL